MPPTSNDGADDPRARWRCGPPSCAVSRSLRRRTPPFEPETHRCRGGVQWIGSVGTTVARASRSVAPERALIVRARRTRRRPTSGSGRRRSDRGARRRGDGRAPGGPAEHRRSTVSRAARSEPNRSEQHERCRGEPDDRRRHRRPRVSSPTSSIVPSIPAPGQAARSAGGAECPSATLRGQRPPRRSRRPAGRVVAGSRVDVHDDVDRARELVADRGEGPRRCGLQDQRLESQERVERSVGVAGRHRPVVSGVHRLHERERPRRRGPHRR